MFSIRSCSMPRPALLRLTGMGAKKMGIEWAWNDGYKAAVEDVLKLLRTKGVSGLPAQSLADDLADRIAYRFNKYGNLEDNG